MKVMERIFEEQLRKQVEIHKMKMEFMTEKKHNRLDIFNSTMKQNEKL